MQKDWKVPEKEIIMSNATKTIAIVKLVPLKKHYEKMGYTFREIEEYESQMFIGNVDDEKAYYHYPLYKDAKKLIDELQYGYNEFLFVPDNVGMALLPFGWDYAMVIAPAIYDNDLLPESVEFWDARFEDE